MRSAEEPAGVLLRPCSCGRGGTLQKRTPPRCFALAGVALCRSARRRAVVPWPLQRPAEAHAAVLLCSGWRGGALQKRTPPCCCALAGVALWRSARRRAVVLWLAFVMAAQQSRAPPGEGGLFDPPEGGVAGPGLRSRRPWGRPKGATVIFGPACGAIERPAALAPPQWWPQ